MRTVGDDRQLGRRRYERQSPGRGDSRPGRLAWARMAYRALPAEGASRPRSRARVTVSARWWVPSLAYRLRTWVLTVLDETYSSPAISGPVRLVGRYRSTRSSVWLSGSIGSRGFAGAGVGVFPARRPRIPATRAACAVRCRAWRASRPGAGDSRNGSTAPLGSARSSARSRAGAAAI